MVDNINRDDLVKLVESPDAQVIEVLPRPEYEGAHLPRAVHAPLGDLSRWWQRMGF